jgi:hypothetical protein
MSIDHAGICERDGKGITRAHKNFGGLDSIASPFAAGTAYRKDRNTCESKAIRK